MAVKITDYSTNLTGSTWIDVNTLFTMNDLPDRVPDSMSISASSLVNLFNCPIGARGPLFEPEYGAALYQLLQEPIDAQTADAINMGLIQALARWEPRIRLDYSGTYVIPDYNVPGYRIRITYTEDLTGVRQVTDFTVSNTGGF